MQNYFFHICCILQFLFIALCGFKISCVCACNHVDSSIVKLNAYELVFCATLHFVSVRDALLSVTGSMLTWCNWTISNLNDYAETMLLTSVDCRSEWEIQCYSDPNFYLFISCCFFWGGAAIFIHFFFFSKCLTFLVKHVSRLCQLC